MSSIFDQLYSQLNDNQKKAVDTIEGPVVVNAGPGTGKTQILTLRIANILRQQGADMAENILALTFTNAGVTAMRQRLADIIGSDAYRVGIFTFHSFAEYLIKKYPDYFADMWASRPITDVRRYQIVGDIITAGDFSILRPFTTPLFHVPSILSAIDEIKRDNFSPDGFKQWNEHYKQQLLDDENSYYKRNGKSFAKGDIKPYALKKYEKNLELVQVYQTYQDKLESEHLYDFNDMILRVIDAVEKFEDFQYELQERHQYILVDEHQDTNAAQGRIIELLIDASHLDGHPNIFTVGDDKQSIYRFQGASLENFLSFEKKYSDVQIINLVENYRSGQQMLDSSHSLIIRDATDRSHQQLQAQHTDSAIACHGFNTYADELQYVGSTIAQLQKNGVKLRDIAIMYRTNKQTDDIRHVLARFGLPAVVMFKENILETPLIYKIVLLLGCVNDLTDDKKIAELLYSNVFDTRTYDVIQIIEKAKKDHCHIFDVISSSANMCTVNLQNPDTFLHIAHILELSHTEFSSNTFLTSFDLLMHSTGLLEHIITSDSSAEQLRYYDRFYSELRSLADDNLHLCLEDVLAYVDILREYNLTLDSKPQDHIDAVRLMTVHKSKGLEFEYVFIINMVDKVWGNKTLRQEYQLPTGSVRGDDDDERRLLYVGITRARKECYITYAKQTGEKITDPSAFLYDIDKSVMSWNTHDESVDMGEQYTSIDQAVLHQSLYDDELILSLYKRRSLSVTSLNNYLDCPAKYFVNNLLQVPATYARSLVYGSVIHSALEQFFTQSKKIGRIAEKDTLIEIFIHTLSSENLDDIETKRIQEKGIENLSSYYDEHASSWSYNVENEVRINGVHLLLPNNTITLTGILDKIEIAENGTDIRVIDYKTGKNYSEKSKEQKEALDRQIVFYALLLDFYRDGYFNMISGILDFIEPHTKTGVHEQHEMSPSDDDKNSLMHLIDQMDQKVRQGAAFLDDRCGKPDCDACQLLRNLK